MFSLRIKQALSRSDKFSIFPLKQQLGVGEKSRQVQRSAWNWSTASAVRMNVIGISFSLIRVSNRLVGSPLPKLFGGRGYVIVVSLVDVFSQGYDMFELFIVDRFILYKFVFSHDVGWICSSIYCASFFILSFARCSPATSFPIFFSCQPKKKFCCVLKKASHFSRNVNLIASSFNSSLQHSFVIVMNCVQRWRQPQRINYK